MISKKQTLVLKKREAQLLEVVSELSGATKEELLRAYFFPALEKLFLEKTTKIRTGEEMEEAFQIQMPEVNKEERAKVKARLKRLIAEQNHQA